MGQLQPSVRSAEIFLDPASGHGIPVRLDRERRLGVTARARRLAISGLGGWLLAIPFFRAALHSPPAPALSALPFVHQSPLRSPSEAAWWEAKRHWMQASSEVGGQLEALAEWDPQPDAGSREGQRWQELIQCGRAADRRSGRRGGGGC